MAFHSIWVRGDRVRTSSCFLPLPCLPAHPKRRTQHLRCACLAGEERRWHDQPRIEARWGWEWGRCDLGEFLSASPAVRSSGCGQQERCWSCGCRWQHSGDCGWELSNLCHLSNDTNVVIHNQLRGNSYWVWLFFTAGCQGPVQGGFQRWLQLPLFKKWFW